MDEFIKVAVLENEIEAQLIDVILKEKEIPHVLMSYHDMAYDGLYQMIRGWGYIAAPEEYKEEIQKILTNVRENKDEI